MTTARSALPSPDTQPNAPAYTPRGVDSTRSTISIVRRLGAPVNSLRARFAYDGHHGRLRSTLCPRYWATAASGVGVGSA